MISRWLRLAIALTVSLVAGLTTWLVGTGLADVAAAGVASLMVLAIAISLAFLMLVILSQSARRNGAASERSDLGAVLRSVPAELLAWAAIFLVLQPFEQFWMGKGTRVGGGRPAVLLVHGYLCNRAIWWRMRSRLSKHGFCVATLNLEPPCASIEAFAEQLHRAIETLAAEAAAERVELVTHSMGGLVARAYLKRHGATRVAKLVTLACPHHGTAMARMGIGRAAGEMEPGSPFLRSLPDAAPPGLQTLTIWSPIDILVAPADSARLAGAQEQPLPNLGHLAMLFSPLVLDIVLDELLA